MRTTGECADEWLLSDPSHHVPRVAHMSLSGVSVHYPEQASKSPLQNSGSTPLLELAAETHVGIIMNKARRNPSRTGSTVSWYS